MAEAAELSDFKILSGKGLVARDINGKSDPYYILGLCDNSGKFVGPAPVKSDYVNATLEPVWLHSNAKRKASLSATLPIGQATGIRIEIWDYDRIGSDEFMGESVIFFKDFRSDYKTQYWTLSLEPRKSKPKEKITGQIVTSFKYYTRAWDGNNKKDEEDKRRARIKEAEIGIQKKEEADFVFRQARASEMRLQIEREMQEERARSMSLTVEVQSLTSSLHVRPMDISLAEIQRASQLFVAATGGGANAVIKSKDQLRYVLTHMGVFDEVARYVFWSGARSAGIDAAAADKASKEGAKNDPLVIQTQNEQVWEMFDLDKDSTINFEELIIGLAMHTKADQRSRAEFYFGIFDKKGKGYLDRDEVLHLLQMQWKCAIGAMRGGLVNTLLNHPELVNVDPAEIRKIGETIEARIRELDVPSSLADVVFKTADTDKSGTISKAEYILFISDPAAQESLQESIRASLMTAQIATKELVSSKLQEIFEQMQVQM